MTMKPDHLSHSLLLRAMDDELSQTETAAVESHLLDCKACKRDYQELRLVSARVESLLAGVVAPDFLTERESLAEKLEQRQGLRTAAPSSEKVLRRFGWGMAIAATLAIGIISLPSRHTLTANRAEVSQTQSSGSFEVDGETFTPLPYSNPELPVSTSHIVQMQVPVSSLTEAGVIFEPVSNEFSERDARVSADVLLGMDGQPLGVHVLGVE